MFSNIASVRTGIGLVGHVFISVYSHWSPFQCCNIVTKKGRELVWINVVRYLGVYVESSSSFTCSLDSAKGSFYRSFNAVLGKLVELHHMMLSYS